MYLVLKKILFQICIHIILLTFLVNLLSLPNGIIKLDNKAFLFQFNKDNNTQLDHGAEATIVSILEFLHNYYKFLSRINLPTFQGVDKIPHKPTGEGYI